MKLLLDHGADPSINTDTGVTPLMVASGIGWVEGVTYEWSKSETLDVVKLLLDLGLDVNARDTSEGRTALMGAAHKGRTDVITAARGTRRRSSTLTTSAAATRSTSSRRHVAGDRLCRRSRARRRAVRDPASGDRGVAARLHEEGRTQNTAARPHAGLDLRDGSVPLSARRP